MHERESAEPAGSAEDDEAALIGGRRDIGTSGAPATPPTADDAPRRGPAGSLSDAASETGVEPEGHVPTSPRPGGSLAGE